VEEMGYDYEKVHVLHRLQFVNVYFSMTWEIFDCFDGNLPVTHRAKYLFHVSMYISEESVNFYNVRVIK
jgi:hypothetical protein